MRKELSCKFNMVLYNTASRTLASVDSSKLDAKERRETINRARLEKFRHLGIDENMKVGPVNVLIGEVCGGRAAPFTSTNCRLDPTCGL
jgi:hypothetical protein